MKPLLYKELKTLFSSSKLGYLAIVFFLILGTLVWTIGKYFNGEGFHYLSLLQFVKILPLLFVLLVPAFLSLFFTQEKKSDFAIGLFWNRFSLSLIFVLFVFLLTASYVFFDCWMRGQCADIEKVVLCYLSVLLLVLLFIIVDVIVSFWINKAWLILALGILLNVCIYGGGVYFFSKYLGFIEETSNLPTKIEVIEPTIVKDIAFIEGHGELEQVYVLDAEEVLSQDYNIHRGEIGNQVGVLNGLAAIIIAGSQSKFSESEKYVLDQYIMQGGRVLWLIDGVYISHEDMKKQGWSASIQNDVNLSDLLFNYGVVVKPQLIQDRHCSSTQLISNETEEFRLLPNYYSPLIDFSAEQSNRMNKGVLSLLLNFASSIDTITGFGKVRKEVLFTSSSLTKLVDIPERIDFSLGAADVPNEYFDKKNIPMAVALEGYFTSLYTKKKNPQDTIISHEEMLEESIFTKMVVVGSSSLIKNELRGQGENTEVLPMGFDRANNIILDNRIFLKNTLNWLTEDGEPHVLDADSQGVLINNQENIQPFNVFLYTFVNVILSVILTYLIFVHRGRKQRDNIK